MLNEKVSADHSMKVLFVGLGSIGQRHLQNLRECVSVETTVMAYRTSDSNSVIENGQLIPCESLAGHYSLVEYSSFDKALEQNPDVGFVCNPSSLHLETAIKLAHNGSHLFVEKPLATDVRGLSVLEDLIREYELTTMVGYHTRFDPAVREVYC